ncbi:hypothetical protein [Deinococcus frigens]|uniref:hypothetical protein n=1 Tax=Deinococcus frigens TaxID=249403 RepID=UPI0004966A7D|nr:hypothetical protein [Deinococcus frigens]
MRPWMLEAPEHDLTAAELAVFAAAWGARDVSLLPPQLPRWLFLQWLTGQGYLLHGSQQGGVTRFEPRTPPDRSPDEFSKRSGVFAASDGLWALMYALRDRTRVQRILNMALRLAGDTGWSSTQYFLSFAPRENGVVGPRELLAPGFVYVLPRVGFEQMPPYFWPDLAEVLEPHWVSPSAVKPLLCIPVRPADFPLPVRTHDAARVDAQAAADPWGFPWLER